MEAIGGAADMAAKRRLSQASDKPSNVVPFPLVRKPAVAIEFGTGWYHAAAIRDEQQTPRKA